MVATQYLKVGEKMRMNDLIIMQQDMIVPAIKTNEVDGTFEPLAQITNGFLNFPSVNRVFGINENNFIRLWVLSSVVDFKTKQKYCDYFASKIEEKLDQDYLFDLRILGLSSSELANIPKAIRVFERN